MGLGADLCELGHDFIELSHRLQPKFDHRPDQNLTLDLVNPELVIDDTLDKLDFIPQELIVFIELG